MKNILKSLSALIVAGLIGFAIIRLTGSFSDEIQTTPSDLEIQTGTSIELYYYVQADDETADGNILCSADAVQPLERTTNDYSITKHFQILFDGPTTQEQNQGFSSEFPLSGFSLQSTELTQDGILKLYLEDKNLASVGGSCRVGLLASQVTKTAESISGVQEVQVFPVDLFQP